jgi:hypothetical protein
VRRSPPAMIDVAAPTYRRTLVGGVTVREGTAMRALLIAVVVLMLSGCSPKADLGASAPLAPPPQAAPEPLASTAP